MKVRKFLTLLATSACCVLLSGCSLLGSLHGWDYEGPPTKDDGTVVIDPSYEVQTITITNDGTEVDYFILRCLPDPDTFPPEGNGGAL